MTMYFRNRKYKSEINCSFFAKNGDSVDLLARCLIGDKVTLSFDISEEIRSSIHNLSEDSGVKANSFVGGASWFVFIPFRCVDRNHSFSWESPGTVRSLATNIFLEAENGYWEDVFLWICLGEKPIWAD